MSKKKLPYVFIFYMKIIHHILCDFLILIFIVFSASSRAQDVNRGGILNTTYMVEKLHIHLFDGQAEIQAAPGSATKITTRVVGDPVFGDLNKDGKEDAALILVQDPGGSGTFYYVAAAVFENGQWKGTNAIFLGDRISLQMIKICEGLITVSYMDRGPDQSMAAPPSETITVYLALKNGHLEAKGED